MRMCVIFFLVILAAPLLVLVIIYNGHVSRRNAVEYAFSSIDVQLKKRWDLVPQLVETVKGYAKHEKETLERIVRARQLAKVAEHRMGERFMHESEISRDLPNLIGLAEQYPDLKADKQFLWLQRNLTEIESQISAARRAYNAAVNAYNDGIQMFPGSLVAGMFHFERKEYFDIDASERGVRNVQL
ncbi:protein LemA [Rubritalea halochordaticola]|uniref:Protein LemA n=2 Tax=Rubritalea halochordaticola TaxID=714537 RepID=A0ABP9V429_9BACT